MKKLLYLCALALLGLVGCTNSDEPMSMDDNGNEPLLRLTASQGVCIANEQDATRAADNLYTLTSGFGGTEQVEVWFNSTHQTYSVGEPDGTTHKSDLSGGSLRYPSANTGTADLWAVYPAASGTAGSHTVAYDQTTAAAYKTSDLMYAHASVDLTDKSATQDLTFLHQLVKLKLVVTKGNDFTDITEIMLKNVKRETTVTADATGLTLSDLTTATGSDADSGDNILVMNESITDGDAHTYCVVFPPQTWDDELFLTVVADGETKTFFLTKNDFVGGNEYTLTLGITQEVDSPTFQIEVQPFGSAEDLILSREGFSN